MKIVFYSVVLNNHQASLADEFYSILGKDFHFVELINLGNTKGSTEDYTKRPYLIQAWKSNQLYDYAMDLAKTAEVCVFSENISLPFLCERMKLNLLSFQYSERWLKRGLLNILSPRLLKYLWLYHTKNWNNKPLYKLCASAFASSDDNLLGMFKNKCYKWGYFTHVNSISNISSILATRTEKVHIMWCARFLKLKHPELPILLAKRLKEKGYNFILNMYGEGIEKENSKQLVKAMQVDDVICFKGNIPNDQLLKDMQEHEIFLFTSDRHEGWGAVANESMSNGCVLVSSNAIGSSPYLIKEGITGLMFQSCNLDSLIQKVEWLLNHPIEKQKIRNNSYQLMQKIWSPSEAARRFLILAKELQEQKQTPFKDGPCSVAELLYDNKYK